MHLSKLTGHAIRMLVECARADGLITGPELSLKLEISTHHVFKIILVLTRLGFIRTVRGQSGGILLAAPAADIRLGDVFRKLEHTCVTIDGGSGAKGTESCEMINGILNKALEAFNAELDRRSLQDLLDSERRTGFTRARHS